MKKFLKKFVSITVCVCLVVSVFGFYSVFADSNQGVHLYKGMKALRDQFSRGAGPKVSGFSIDYSYFSPKKSSNDKTKYPLVIFMAGAREGAKEGKELTANNFATWSSIEFQNKFQGSKGAYLLIARAPEPIYWDTAPIASLKAAIDDFIVKNPNVDTTRIYAVGWCLGASGVIHLATKYPGFLAGIMLHAARHFLTISEANKLKNTAVWLLNCKFDMYSFYLLFTLPAWSTLKSKTSNKNKLRLTTCTYAPYSVPIPFHLVWHYTETDMTDPGGCKGLKTIDGFGNELSNLSAISWLSQWSTNN